MTQGALKNIRQSAIEALLENLFSEGKLGDKMQAARTLGDMPGLNLFPTAVPWRVTMPHGKPVNGFSESLRFAAKDIHAHLWVMAKSLPVDATVTIEIDETRLIAAGGQ